VMHGITRDRHVRSDRASPHRRCGSRKTALAEMQIGLQNMLDAINADRAARGVLPLDVTLPRLPQ
jgi:hypothetical protein